MTVGGLLRSDRLDALQGDSMTLQQLLAGNAMNLLRQDHDKAAVKLNLAVCLSAKQDRKRALIMIQDAKRLDTKGMLKKDIKQVESMIKNPRVVQRGRR